VKITGLRIGSKEDLNGCLGIDYLNPQPGLYKLSFEPVANLYGLYQYAFSAKGV